MSEDGDVRWNLVVSRETDRTLRTFLGARGMKKGDLSKFVEEAVRQRVFQRTVEEIEARAAGPEAAEFERLAEDRVVGERLIVQG